MNTTCPACGHEFDAGGKFHPPTEAEVQAHIDDKGYTFSASAFVSHYISNGWKVGKNPMKSWRAACVTWQEREDERHPDNAFATAKKTKALKKHLSAAGYAVPTPEWVLDLRRRIDAREPWSPAELQAMKLWEAGIDVAIPKKPQSWTEAENA